MFRAIRLRIGPCDTAVTRVALSCLCNLYIETRQPKYVIVLYLECVVNFCITHQDSQIYTQTHEEKGSYTFLISSNGFVQK